MATTAARVAAEVVASPIFYLFAGLATVKLITSTGEQTAGILLAAAAPVTLLTALSKSDVGRRVQERLEERLPLLRAELAAGLGPWLTDSSAALKRLETRLAVRIVVPCARTPTHPECCIGSYLLLRCMLHTTRTVPHHGSCFGGCPAGRFRNHNMP